jgi:hypothetical protein
MTQLAEASMNFDEDLAPPFVERLSSLVAGFGPAQVAEVRRALEELDIDENRELAFIVEYERRAVPLKIRILMDEVVRAPDMYFFTAPALAKRIDELMVTFCEERGIATVRFDREVRTGSGNR